MQPTNRRQGSTATQRSSSTVSNGGEAPPPSQIRHSIAPVLQRESTSNNIKVVARFRPKNELEISLETGKPDLIKFVNETTMMVGDGKEKETITFDRIFPPCTPQAEVFEQVGIPLIEDVLTGYNGTVFAYGQTGSGKTYSMMGVDLYDEARKGLIPRAASKIFDRVDQMEGNVEFILTCSMLEIYKETMNDLLCNEPNHLKIKEDRRRGIYVQGLTEVSVDCEDDMLELIALGEQMRTVAKTKCNAVSSRSHTLFRLEVKQKFPNESEKRGILNLIDLAGSEKVHLSGVTGNGLEEAKKINLSLSALGNVIHSLINGSDHIPYRDSKLTRLLQESLGGNYKTTILIALSPCFRHFDESINTIKFAQRAKSIKNKVSINIQNSPEEYQKIIDKMTTELHKAYTEITELRGGTGTAETAEKGVNTDAIDTVMMRHQRRMPSLELSTQHSQSTDLKPQLTAPQLTFAQSQLTVPQHTGSNTHLSGAQFLHSTGPMQTAISQTQAFAQSQFTLASYKVLKEIGEHPHDRSESRASEAADSQSYIASAEKSLKGVVPEDKYDYMKKKYRAKLRDAQATCSMIDDDRDNLRAQVTELDSALQSTRHNLLHERNDRVKYYKMYHQSLSLINKDDHMNDLLKKQVESLENQVKSLTRNLDFIDERFKRFIEDIESGQPATLLEFSDMGSDVTCLDAEQQGLDVSRIPEIIREIPLESEVLAKAQLYTEAMLAVLERNSGLSGQLEAYQLKNQVIQ